MHGKTWISRLIERVTHSDTHHTVIGLPGGLVASAEPIVGVIIRPASDYPDFVWSQFELTDLERDQIVWYAEASVGMKYNYMAFILMGLFGLAGLRVPRRLASLLSSSNRKDCSQLCAEVYALAGRPLFAHPHWMVVPGDFEEWFTLHQWSMAPTPTRFITI